MPLELYNTAWSMLRYATVQRREAWHLTNVATIGLDGRPKVRSVVLRDAELETLTLRFHTDGRSGKIAEIAVNPFVELHFYDQPANLQLRVSGRATVHALPDALALDAWDAARKMSKVCYRLVEGPGTPIEDGDGYGYSPFDGEGIDPGAANFRAVTIKADMLEVVQLKLDANRRARFELKDGKVNAMWLVP
jgi:pyridoxamine 5'-phosphate oxidase